jgi:hypothetical protein
MGRSERTLCYLTFRCGWTSQKADLVQYWLTPKRTKIWRPAYWLIFNSQICCWWSLSETVKRENVSCSEHKDWAPPSEKYLAENSGLWLAKDAFSGPVFSWTCYICDRPFDCPVVLLVKRGCSEVYNVVSASVWPEDDQVGPKHAEN